MKMGRIFDLIIWVFIAATGLAAAYICFGILNSEASGQFKQYSVGGAIGGALVSWGVLTTVYLQIRGSSGELQKLRDRNDELHHKLIRGAPRPEGFDTEVDERQRIVLARPVGWQPKGGTIFRLQVPRENMEEGDTFASEFQCYFKTIGDSTLPQAGFY
ncbi:MAG: hypothetical protein ACYSWU_05310, partial [Planctomycetota bacterium]